MSAAATVLNEISIAEEQLRAFNSQDWAALRKTAHQDFVYREFSATEPVRGPDAAIAAFQKWIEAFPDMKGTVTNTVAEGNKVVLEITWSGTQTGALQGPLGAIPPTNKWGEVHALQMYVFEGDQIKELRHYFDSVEMLRQLGMIPA